MLSSLALVEHQLSPVPLSDGAAVGYRIIRVVLVTAATNKGKVAVRQLLPFYVGTLGGVMTNHEKSGP